MVHDHPRPLGPTGLAGKPSGPPAGHGLPPTRDRLPIGWDGGEAPAGVYAVQLEATTDGERPSPSNTPCASSDEAVDLFHRWGRVAVLLLGLAASRTGSRGPMGGWRPGLDHPAAWGLGKAGCPPESNMQNAGPRGRRLSAAIGSAPDGAYKTPAQADRAPNGPRLDLHARPPGQRLDRGRHVPQAPCACPRPGWNGSADSRRRAPLDADGRNWSWMPNTARGIQPRRQHGGTRRASRGRILASRGHPWRRRRKPRRRGQSGPARAAQPAFTTPLAGPAPFLPIAADTTSRRCRGGAKAMGDLGWRTQWQPGTAAASRVRRPCRNRRWTGPDVRQCVSLHPGCAKPPPPHWLPWRSDGFLRLP